MNIQLISLRQNETFQFNFNESYGIWFMLTGSCTCSSHESIEYELMERQMVFHTLSSQLSYTAQTDAQAMLMVFEKLTNPHTIEFINTLPEPSEEAMHKPYLLSIKPKVDHFFSFIFMLYGTPWFKDQHLIQLIIDGTFYLYKATYTKEENSAFFANLIRRKFRFKELVTASYKKARNAKELAKLCQYSSHTFNRIFKKEFGVTPYQWLMEQRMKDVRHTILTDSRPLGIIAEEYYFSSSAHLSTFFKKYYGIAPSQLRANGAKHIRL